MSNVLTGTQQRVVLHNIFKYAVSEHYLLELILEKDNLGKVISRDPRQLCSSDKMEIISKICSKFGLDLIDVNVDKTILAISSKLKHLHQRHCKEGRKGGTQVKQFLNKLQLTSCEIEIQFNSDASCRLALHRELVKKSNQCRDLATAKSAAQRYYQSCFSLRQQNRQLQRKLFGLRHRGLSRKHAALNIPYSRAQKSRQRRTIVRDIRRAVAAIGIPTQDVVSIKLRDKDSTVKEIMLNPHTENAEIISERDVEYLNMVLYVKDLALISDDHYHELSMVCRALPRFYRVKERIRQLNSTYHITDTPGSYVGVQQCISETLPARLESMINANPNLFSSEEENVLQIKISGDGTKIGKRIHLVNFGYSIINKGFSPSEITLLAVVKMPERYDAITEALVDVISKLKEFKSFVIQGCRFNFEYFLCGDLKFLNCVCGIDAANCTYACLWCKCPANKRHCMDMSWSMKHAEGCARTIEEIENLASQKQKGAKVFNCSHSPIFPFIPIIRVVPDKLHLFLRISDQLIMKLIEALLRQDNIIRSVKTYDRSRMECIARFEDFVKSLGFYFEFYVDKNGSGMLSCTDLPAHHRLKLMKAIDLKSFYTDTEEGEQIATLWSEFLAIMDLLDTAENADDAKVLGQKAKDWVSFYSAEVYLASDVTPYMHILAYHVCESISLHGNLRSFSQQSFKYVNHTMTQQFFRGSSHRNRAALEQVLKRQNRICSLNTAALRIKRSYHCAECSASGHSRPTCPKRVPLRVSNE